MGKDPPAGGSRYFFDTYALVEISRDSPPYRPYRTIPGHTTQMNLMEVYYILAEGGLPEVAAWCLDRYLPGSIKEIPRPILVEAMNFRLHRRDARGRRFSYADAIGYTCATAHGLIFLTGDEGFRGFPNVELVR